MPQLYVSQKSGVKRTDQGITSGGAEGSRSAEYTGQGGTLN